MPIASRGRVAVIASLAVAVALTSGCSWFRKDNDAYKLSGEARPLEIPPELDRPSADAAMALPEGGTSVMASQADKRAPATPAVTGAFVVPGQRDAVYARLDEVLSSMPGVTVHNRSKLLGSLDVSYQEANFLVRTVQATSGVSVSAVDPRGMPDSREAAVALLGQLKASLGGQ